jgi:succinyl-CoA synthetase beta subunit
MASLERPGRPDEFEAKQLLRAFGVPVPEAVRIRDRDQVPGTLPEPPFAVKVCSPDIGHKTDAGGVRLNVPRPELPGVVADMNAAFPGMALLVESMVRFQGPEFIVGALVDPDYGVAVMAGAGGILTELYRDAGFRLAPCSQAEAASMLDELAIAPVLKGFRGMVLDRTRLAGIVSTAGRIALALEGNFSQLDINPVVFARDRWTALDAQLILKDSGA